MATQFGNYLILAGLIMFIAVLYLAYSLYSSLSNQGPQTTLPNSPSGTPSGAIDVLVSNMTLIIYSESYIYIKIAILFLIAYVAGKLVSLGITSNKNPAKDEDEEESPSPSKKGKSSTNPY